MNDKVTQAAELIKNSRHTIAFTGAGISVESGIPPFRGKGGLWDKHDPMLFDIGYFKAHPDKSWALIKEIFLDTFGKANPNEAHKGLAELENKGYIKAIITQNIDGLHQKAGSGNVYEFHGTCRTISCLLCKFSFEAGKVSLEKLPPRCPYCLGILRPDFVFFGEPIPRDVNVQSFYEAQISDVCIVIGSTGEVMPACQVPIHAKSKGAKIIEINTTPSNFTPTVTDIFLQGKAAETMPLILKEIG